MDCRNSLCTRLSVAASSNNMRGSRDDDSATLPESGRSRKKRRLGGFLWSVTEIVQTEIANVIHQMVEKYGLHGIFNGRFRPYDNGKGQFVFP